MTNGYPIPCTIAPSAPLLAYTVLALAFVATVSWLNTSAHARADEAHRIYCEIARENCDPFYQQIP